jgi:hypothetical protein
MSKLPTHKDRFYVIDEDNGWFYIYDRKIRGMITEEHNPLVPDPAFWRDANFALALCATLEKEHRANET